MRCAETTRACCLDENGHRWKGRSLTGCPWFLGNARESGGPSNGGRDGGRRTEGDDNTRRMWLAGIWLAGIWLAGRSGKKRDGRNGMASMRDGVQAVLVTSSALLSLLVKSYSPTQYNQSNVASLTYGWPRVNGVFIYVARL